MTTLPTGAIDDLLANKVFGERDPLGFSLKAQVLGMSVEFTQKSLERKGPRLPKPIAHPTDTRYHQGTLLPPAPMPVPTLRFTAEGISLPLYGRQKLRWVGGLVSGWVG